MSVTALKKSEDVTLKLVTEKIKSNLLVENQLKAVGDGIVSDDFIHASPVKKANGKFTITFSYEHNLHRTKVVMTQGGYGLPVYKIALSTSLSADANICWLQKTPEGWNNLLGNNINDVLKNALTAAIEQQA